MINTLKKNIVVYAESTPNPSAMKFVANIPILPFGRTAEFKSVPAESVSPLAARFFQFPFVNRVFISDNYVTLTKNDTAVWEEVLHPVRDFLKLFLEEEKIAVIEFPPVSEPAESGVLENKINAILEEYIRPAVEQDGGQISFKSFQDGVVTVQLKGSCSGCPSSTLTLKAGIEALLKRMVPEVTEVVAEPA